MTSVQALKGKHRWVTVNSLGSTLCGVLAAALYIAFDVQIPQSHLVSFFVVVVGVTAVLATIGDRIEQRGLRTLRRLGDGTVAPTPANALIAMRELAATPKRSFMNGVLLFGGGSWLVAVLWYLAADPPGVTAARIALVGTSVAPLTALLSVLTSLHRVRIVQTQLIELKVHRRDAYRALKSTDSLPQRLVFFTVAAVMTPLALIIETSVFRARAALALARQNPALSADQVVDTVDGHASLGVIVLGLTILLIVVAAGWLSGRMVSDPLHTLSEATERLSRGDIGQGVWVASEVEIFAAASAVHFTSHHLGELRTHLDKTAQALTGLTDELVRGARQQNQGADEQTASLNATAATTEELARSARHIAQSAERVNLLATQTLEAARRGSESAESFTHAVAGVRQGNQAIADSVVRLNKRVQQVSKIVEFIDGIADKSDLLALNAELEGSKAGEVGRGFSLVAAEMRRLAESVMSSTQEIARLIEEIRDATNAAVMATEAGVKATDSGMVLAQRVRDGIDEIVAFANRSAGAMASITAATNQQEVGTTQLVQAISDIARSTQEGAKASQAVMSTSQDLALLEKDLKEMVRSVGGRGA